MKRTRVCSITNTPFEISPLEVEAYGYFSLPLPDVCPAEQHRRQLAFCGRQQFYWRDCYTTGKRIYSVYPSSTPFPVVSSDVWRSDEVDAVAYGREYDSQKPFLEQLYDLWKTVPRPAQSVGGVVHSLAVRDSHSVKHSFLISEASEVERCYYAVGIRRSADCVDCLFVSDSEQCFDCLDCHSCSKLRWGEHCWNCRDSWYLFNCQDCEECLCCANIQGKRHWVFNKQVSEEEYQRTLAEFQLRVRPMAESVKERYSAFLKTQLVPHMYTDNPGSASGNYLYRTTRALESFYCFDSDNIVRCSALEKANQCLDGYGFGPDISNAAQFVSVGVSAKNILNCVDCWNQVEHLMYSFACESCSHLLGCVGLKNKEYCVLNKQYSPAQYQEIRVFVEAKLREEHQWGRYLPLAFSPFAYNQSAAQESMPLNETQAALMNYLWDEDDNVVKPSQLLGAQPEGGGDRFSDPPAELEGSDMSELSRQIFICEMTGKPFQYSLEELRLYETLGVYPPARSFEQRHRQRLSRLSPKRMRWGRCSATDESIYTAFPESWSGPIASFVHWRQVLTQESA